MCGGHIECFSGVPAARDPVLDGGAATLGPAHRRKTRDERAPKTGSVQLLDASSRP